MTTTLAVPAVPGHRLLWDGRTVKGHWGCQCGAREPARPRADADHDQPVRQWHRQHRLEVGQPQRLARYHAAQTAPWRRHLVGDPTAPPPLTTLYRTV